MSILQRAVIARASDQGSKANLLQDVFIEGGSLLQRAELVGERMGDLREAHERAVGQLVQVGRTRHWLVRSGHWVGVGVPEPGG